MSRPHHGYRAPERQIVVLAPGQAVTLLWQDAEFRPTIQEDLDGPPATRNKELMTMTRPELERAFTEWDKRYRADPSGFMNDVDHLLGHTPETYGEACAIYFEALLADTTGQLEETKESTTPATSA